jgi:hypothetical protein
MPSIKARSIKATTPRGVRVVRNREIIRIPRRTKATTDTKCQPQRDAEPPAA